jgi:Methyltransferase domain
MGYARTLKTVAKSILPHGMVMAGRRSQALRRQQQMAALAGSSIPREPYSYPASIAYLCSRGLPRDHVVNGSIPETSLAFCSAHLDRMLPTDRPLIGLHVGNFLGVSLAYFAHYAQRRHPDSVTFSIDPNLTHRGIESPQDHVIAVLNHFDLQRNAMICVGYSGGKSVSNDGSVFIGRDGAEYDPLTAFAAEQACEGSLANLRIIGEGRFDFAVMDGNHDAPYLRKETDLVRKLLRPVGVLILDDVDDTWAEIKAEFGRLGAAGWKAIGADGRVGVLVTGTGQ